MFDSRLRDTALSRWLMRRSAWVYVCVVAGAAFALLAASGAAVQWVFFSPVELHAVLDGAVVGTVVTTVSFYRLRVNTLGEQLLPPADDQASRP